MTLTFKCLTFVSIFPSKLVLEEMFILPKISSNIIKAGIKGSLAYFLVTYSSYSVSYIILKFASN